MLVKEIMTYGAEFIESHNTLFNAAQKMRDLNIGVLPVFEDGHVIGMLTDRDIAIRAVAEMRNPAKTLVKEVMTESVLAVTEDSTIENAARVMEENRIRRLLVKDSSGKVSGVISLGDLAVFATKDLSGEVLKIVSEPSIPHR